MMSVADSSSRVSTVGPTTSSNRTGDPACLDLLAPAHLLDMRGCALSCCMIFLAVVKAFR